jgi:hypothetical protein
VPSLIPRPTIMTAFPPFLSFALHPLTPYPLLSAIEDPPSLSDERVGRRSVLSCTVVSIFP